jgi:broad specificity phosphatase PhoE
MTQLFLVRHGQTDWNVSRRHQGQKDVPLNAEGVRQAEELAARLAAEHFDAIYSSDLQRALRTAQILAHGHRLDVITDLRLREVSVGEWEGTYVEDNLRASPERFTASHVDPTIPLAPGGESTAQVAERTAAFANEVSQKFPQGRVMVVAHGLTLAALMCLAGGIPLTETHKHIPDNAAAIEIHWG